MDTIPEERKLEALEKAAEHFNYIEFSWRDFNKVAPISASAIKTHFGSWKKALAALKNISNRKVWTYLHVLMLRNGFIPIAICLTRWEGFGKKWANGHQEMSGTFQSQKLVSLHTKSGSEAGEMHVKNLLNIKWVEKLHRILS